MLAPGAAGEGDRDQPEIGHEDRQRAEHQEAVEEQVWSSRRRVRARAASRAQSVAGAATGGASVAS